MQMWPGAVGLWILLLRDGDRPTVCHERTVVRAGFRGPRLRDGRRWPKGVRDRNISPVGNQTGFRLYRSQTLALVRGGVRETGRRAMTLKRSCAIPLRATRRYRARDRTGNRCGAIRHAGRRQNVRYHVGNLHHVRLRGTSLHRASSRARIRRHAEYRCSALVRAERHSAEDACPTQNRHRARTSIGTRHHNIYWHRIERRDRARTLRRDRCFQMRGERADHGPPLQERTNTGKMIRSSPGR